MRIDRVVETRFRPNGTDSIAAALAPDFDGWSHGRPVRATQ